MKHPRHLPRTAALPTNEKEQPSSTRSEQLGRIISQQRKPLRVGRNKHKATVSPVPEEDGDGGRTLTHYSEADLQ